MPTQVDPRIVKCRVCNAAVDAPCNAPTNTGRKNVTWFHLMREADARELVESRETATPSE